MTSSYVSRGSPVSARSYRLAVPPAVIRLPGAVHLQDILQLVREGADERDGPGISHSGVSATTSLEELASLGRVLDTYVTAGPVPGCGVSLSIVVTSVTVEDAGQRAGPRESFAGARGRQSLLIGGEPAICVSSVSSGAEWPVTGGMRVLRAKTVISCVPGDDDVLISFAVMVAQLEGGASPDTSEDETQAVADALVELFDAMMTTVRWLDDQGRVITDRPTT